jgi:hypothetical protein
VLYTPGHHALGIAFGVVAALNALALRNYRGTALAELAADQRSVAQPPGARSRPTPEDRDQHPARSARERRNTPKAAAVPAVEGTSAGATRSAFWDTVRCRRAPGRSLPNRSRPWSGSPSGTAPKPEHLGPWLRSVQCPTLRWSHRPPCCTGAFASLPCEDPHALSEAEGEDD